MKEIYIIDKQEFTEKELMNKYSIEVVSWDIRKDGKRDLLTGYIGRFPYAEFATLDIMKSRIKSG